MNIEGRQLALFGDLSDERREDLKSLAMILCPEIFGTSTTKFERVPLVFLEFGPAVSSNIRDLFSAGGRCNYQNSDGKQIKLRAIDEKLRKSAQAIEEALQSLPHEALERYWSLNVDDDSRMEIYLKLLDRHSQLSGLDINLSTVFLDEIGRQNDKRAAVADE